jgi:ribosomal protein S18 acetylase RimI-like enzyme
MNNILIRQARLDDLEILLEFEQAMIETERPFDPTIKRSQTYYYDIPQLIASPDIELVVAVSDGSLIASGYARIERSDAFSEHSHHSYLGFMYVMPEHRGKGVNKLVVYDLFEWSRKRGVHEIRLEVFTENLAAIRAYEKQVLCRIF